MFLEENAESISCTFANWKALQEALVLLKVWDPSSIIVLMKNLVSWNEQSIPVNNYLKEILLYLQCSKGLLVGFPLDDYLIFCLECRSGHVKELQYMHMIASMVT
jgi:hypothetical protein